MSSGENCFLNGSMMQALHCSGSIRRQNLILKQPTLPYILKGQ
ncbi:hypothetical protein FOPG_19026, partial [Fusarium oxysporum f. sp. conglutinans race 2 54008]